MHSSVAASRGLRRPSAEPSSSIIVAWPGPSWTWLKVKVCHEGVDLARRRGVTWLERAGVPRSVAMKITGHKTEAVYQRYAIVSDADLQDAARRLAGTFTGTIRVAEVAPVS